jgi:hypothetical protein
LERCDGETRAAEEVHHDREKLFAAGGGDLYRRPGALAPPSPAGRSRSAAIMPVAGWIAFVVAAGLAWLGWASRA